VHAVAKQIVPTPAAAFLAPPQVPVKLTNQAQRPSQPVQQSPSVAQPPMQQIPVPVSMPVTPTVAMPAMPPMPVSTPAMPNGAMPPMPPMPVSMPALTPNAANGGLQFAQQAVQFALSNPGMAPNQQFAPPAANLNEFAPQATMQSQVLPLLAGLGPVMPSSFMGNANSIAALQTSQYNEKLQQYQQATQTMPQPAVSAIQTQYNEQLQQYQQSQKQMSDWAKRYQQYEQTVEANQQKYQAELQQYQAVQQQQRQQMQQTMQQQQRQQMVQPVRRAPPSSLVQTGVRSGNALEAALASREHALAARGKRLAARESALRQKAQVVRAHEVKEEQEQLDLDARDKSLSQKETQVQVLEGQLVQEQKKIWKVLRSRQGVTPPTASSQPVPPPMAQYRAPAHNGARPPMRVQVATRHHATGPRANPLAFAQTGVATHKSHKRAVHRGAAAGTIAAFAASSRAAATAAAGRSDLHVITAAQVPKEGSFGEDVDDDEAADSKAASKSGKDEEEDSKDPPKTPEQEAASADNDDLEAILMQQSSSVSNQGDPVESF